MTSELVTVTAALPWRVVLLTGSMSTAARKAALLDAAVGTAGIVVGTHALIQDVVTFLDLGLPGGQQWRTAMMNLAVFLDNSPQGFYDRMFASKVVPATGEPDPSAMSRFLTKHPETARAMAINGAHPRTSSFADSTYRSLVAFYFVNESGTRTPVRWSLVPLQRALPPSKGLNGLFTPLIRQMRSGPLRWLAENNRSIS